MEKVTLSSLQSKGAAGEEEEENLAIGQHDLPVVSWALMAKLKIFISCLESLSHVSQ